MTLVPIERRQGERRAEQNPNGGQGRAVLKECVRDAVESYFSHLADHDAADLYRLFLNEVEVPLFEAVLRETRGNHSHAAKVLGINRGTLRKKLRHHQLA